MIPRRKSAASYITHPELEINSPLKSLFCVIPLVYIPVSIKWSCRCACCGRYAAKHRIFSACSPDVGCALYDVSSRPSPSASSGAIVVDEEIEHHPHAHEQPLHVPVGLARVLDLRRHRIHTRAVSVKLLLQFPVLYFYSLF